MKKKSEYIGLLMILLLSIMSLYSCQNQGKNTISSKEYNFYEEEIPIKYFKNHLKEYNELFSDKKVGTLIKPTGKEPLFLSDEYEPFTIPLRKRNIGKPLIDVRIKDDSTVICVYVEINTEMYTNEDIEKIKIEYNNRTTK